MVSPEISDENESATDGALPQTYSFGLKNDMSELTVLRQHVENFGQMAGLSQGCLFEIILCLDELFTNIVSYGFDDDRHHLIQFTLQMDNDELVIDVEDGGIPFNPLLKQESGIPIDPKNIKIGGLGIHIVKKLTNDICYQRDHGKNHLTLKKIIETGDSPLAN
ncbi:MAG: ATP-binding protein [Deltaproteobacteria bacterium]|jgi:anti-sigma regulatory factor (Ser/Thr protein kinase)|nr:ATP-binding protein [Deltaproteobacteria bacterium]